MEKIGATNATNSSSATAGRSSAQTHFEECASDAFSGRLLLCKR